MTKILVSYPLPDKWFEKVREIEDVDVVKATEEEEILEEVKDAEVVFDKQISLRAFRAADELEWIQSPYVGVDMLLIDEVVESDVRVTCARGIHSSQVSDHVFAFILCFAREIPGFIENRENRVWEERHPFPFKPLMELKQKNLGVVGLGTIGKEVARKGKCFNMNVLGVKKHQEDLEYVDELFTPKELDRVISRSDFLVLCVPYTPETKDMIGEKELREMKDSAYLINVARGEVLDEDALVQALRGDWVGGAALDVVDTEPLPKDSRLWKVNDLLLTPHVAGSTPRYWKRVYEIFRENIERYKEDKELINMVNKEEGY
ncbi:D-2-hydroxyacid dehydrogenase [archaeon SCG-AAA382B04]|nr:D-2-hydroxyacid dehydrogenase [archaeon SCG-AAA382B04]